jgi:uncharacterized membrane protein
MARDHARSEGPSQKRNSQAGHLVQGLGWLSVGLGIAHLVAPRAFARLAGVAFPHSLMRACGVRELIGGIGLLSQARAAPWLRMRLAGDVVDLIAFAIAAPSRRSGARVALASATVAGLAALDLHALRELGRGSSLPLHTMMSVSVNKPREELYRYWRDLANLPRIMPHLESVTVLDDTRSLWVARAPGGVNVEWEADLIDDAPGQRLAWRSTEGSNVYNAGSVRFDPAPRGRGTLVTVELLYDPPGGPLGATVAKLFGKDAGQQVSADLRAFKQLMETGEISRTEGQSRGGATSGAYEYLSDFARRPLTRSSAQGRSRRSAPKPI